MKLFYVNREPSTALQNTNELKKYVVTQNVHNLTTLQKSECDQLKTHHKSRKVRREHNHSASLVEIFEVEE